jgi:ABC-type glutathione transport system ATPase component
MDEASDQNRIPYLDQQPANGKAKSLFDELLCAERGSRWTTQRRMYAQSSSPRWNRELDSANDHGLDLVEARRDRGRVALRVEALSKRYGAIEALSNVSLDVRHGEVFGLLGLNGAGKSTLISILATERRPSAGDALLLGHSIRDERRVVRQMIGVAPQEIALYPKGQGGATSMRA